MTDNSVDTKQENHNMEVLVGGDASRECTPELSRSIETLEHSMESLIISDSGEEQENSPTQLDEEEDMVDIAFDGRSRTGPPVSGESSQGGEGDSAKGKKRRISQRRARKISLTSSDRVVSKVAGVEIEVVKQGFLLQHGSFQRWNKRYFTITQDKLYVSKNEEEKLREEIILKDTTIAENSSKNVNHSFTVLTPFQQVVLAASSRKEMEEWVNAFKVAASKSKNTGLLETLQHLEGQHSWFACTHSRPTYCNVCHEALHGVAWHGLSCEVCKFKSHRRCVFRVKEVCKWTTRGSLQESSVQLGQDFSIPHQWLEGNLPAGSKCSVCERTCGSLRRLQDFRCLWCKYTVHAECRDKLDRVCTLGDHSLSILPPSALIRSDSIRKGMWEPYQDYGHSPLLACVNSKSGDNLGVKFLRRLKYWLNPAQVFDLAITGPELGLELFQRFEKFRIIVLGGDGSIGWVLSTMDKYNLHSKCMMGVVPLGTGNDMARVLGWGAQCREEEKIPSILLEMEHSSFKLLDRWSLQYIDEQDVDMSPFLRSHSPPKTRVSLESMLSQKSDSSSEFRPPFPGPEHLSSSERGTEIVSPSDSVFGRQESDDRTVDQGSGDTLQTSDEVQDRLMCASPQNTDKINAFHKSISDLAHTFSSILISEDEKNVLKSAEILGGVVKSFLSSVVADMESEMSASDFQNDPLVQKCVVLQDKLASLIANLKAHSDLTRETPPTQKTFVQRDVLMARANSLKKAITGVIDVTEKALDTHSEEIKELTHDIIKCCPKESVSSIASVVDPAPVLPEMKEISVMNNYFGLGLDAQITYKFNTTREKNPAQYKSRAMNMMLYGLLGGKEFFSNSQRYLERRIKLECDGDPVELPQRLQGLVFLNIPSYMAGTNFWGTEREKDGFCAPSHDDKLMEVVAISGFTSIATAKVLGIQNHRLRQCRVAKLILCGTEELPLQVDGEAWLQKPGTIIISHKNKTRMLVKDKAFSQTLESWNQKHSTSSSQLNPGPSSTLHQALSLEDIKHYRELAATIPPLLSYIRSESVHNGDAQRDLLPRVSATVQSLERIFLEGGLISDTADILHLQDFERDLKALVQETRWFLSMQRISSEHEQELTEAIKNVEKAMKKIMTSSNISSSSVSIQSQAHHMFRRGSDTLLLTRPHQSIMTHSPVLPPHRERSAQLVPDDTIQAATVAKRLGKEVESWDEDDVSQWLSGIGMGEYSSTFQQKHMTGKELLRLKKSDMPDMGIHKVGHSTRLYHALQALTSDFSAQRQQRASTSTLHSIPRHNIH